ncbi:MAG TPA: energy transducer TonB [Candidatus Eremiobacteraceae bacterium]|nr:energy transducer TonB [Candidatus Eremiobacteraceae bacterium]
MMARRPGIAIAFVAWLTLCAATSATPPTLAGVAVGSSVLDVEKRFGFPDVAETTDYGSFWQWSERDGLDREIYTDDDLVVESVLVAPARGGSTAQPSEAPMLGIDVSKAATAAASVGAGPTIVKPSTPGIIVWPFGSGYLVAETVGSVVARLRVLDVTSTRRWRYAGDPLATPPHTAATMVREVIAPSVPAGVGEDLILVNLDATGKVTDAKVLIGSGQTDVDRFAIDCVRLSTFKPATCAGVPCAGTYLYSGGILR